jgi:hypothetical protein
MADCGERDSANFVGGRVALSFRLSGEIKDKKLFMEIISAGIPHGGRLFYRQDKKGNIIDPVYFSGGKRVTYTGEIDQEFKSLIWASGSKVDLLEWDKGQGILEIAQR